MRTRLVATAFAAMVTAVPAGDAHAAPLAASGSWADWQGARTTCVQVAATTVACDHVAVAGGATAAPTSRCQSQSVDAAGVVSAGLCRAFLTAHTSGQGQVVTPGFAPTCTTLGNGLVTFTDSTGYAYRDVPVGIVNAGGVAHFRGVVVDSAGIVSEVVGGFGLACGAPDEARVRGEFHGTYEVESVP